MRPDPSIAELLAVFGRIGLISFGGPAGQIALMHKVLVEEKRWLDEERYLHALSFCMLLPGPEAMQLATYAGWTLKGWRGGVIAGLLFILPGAVVITLLSALYLKPPAAPAAAHSKVTVQVHGFTANEALKTWQFGALWWVFFVNITCGIGLLAVASPMAQDVVKMSPAAAASMVLNSSVFC